MPGIRQYPQATENAPTDAFVFDREGAGTMYIEAQNMASGGGGGSDPYIHTYTPYTIEQYQPAVNYIVGTPFRIDQSCVNLSSFRLLDDERQGELTFTIYCWRYTEDGKIEQPIGTIYWPDNMTRFGSMTLTMEWDFQFWDELVIMPPGDVLNLGGAACLACMIKTVASEVGA